MRGSAVRGLLPALVVLGLVGVVAVAATGATERGTDRVRPPSATLLDTILTLGFLGVLAGGVLLAYGLTQRKAIRGEIATGRYRRSSLMGFIVFAVLFAAYAEWRLRDWERTPTESDTLGDAVLPPGHVPPVTPPNGTATAYEPEIAWPAVAAVAALVLLGVAAYLLADRRRRGPDIGASLAEDLAGALDDSLDDLREETDPRRAVIAAYARLEKVLAAHGLPRHAAETPEEYLARILQALEVDRASVARLTDLFERAKFSQHEVDPVMKEDAIRALETVRDELRSMQKVRGEPLAVPTVGAAS